MEASPTSKFAKTHTFKDQLGGWTTSSNKILRMNQSDPIVIEYKIDGQTIVTQVTTEEPGFVCE